MIRKLFGKGGATEPQVNSPEVPEDDSSVQHIVMLQNGALYRADRKQWDEHIQYDYRSGVHELRICLHDLGPADLRALLHNEARFALIVDGPILIMKIAFVGVVNTDVPFTIWRLAPNVRTIPSTPVSGATVLLHVHVVDPATGILLGARRITLSEKFSLALLNAICDQATHSYYEGEDEERLAAFYAAYPTGKDQISRVVAACRIEADPA